MSNPYVGLPQTAYWKTAVGSVPSERIGDLWSPRFRIDKTTAISTYGSCFAQHFRGKLVENGYSWINGEPAPHGMDEATAKALNYGVFSARTGNIYTGAALLQWVNWAAGTTAPPEEYWQKDDHFIDPFRPAIEPGAVTTLDAARASRAEAIAAFGRSIREASVFVFTMGLTEAWVHRTGGYTYAICPGTVAGDFDADLHGFQNHDFPKVLADMKAAIAAMRRLNPELKILLTVSPVPLTATASGQHVLPATTYSKSVLRAVAGSLCAEHDFVDYFPSYEIISSPAMEGRYFEQNKRSVTPAGVAHVMGNFFTAIGDEQPADAPRPVPRPALPEQAGEDDLVCEEELLSAFATPLKGGSDTAIGIIGGSHVSSIRRHFAATGEASVGGMDTAFWMLPGEFQDVVIQDTHLTHANEEKARRFNGEDGVSFDLRGRAGFLLVGEPFAIPLILQELKRNKRLVGRANVDVLADWVFEAASTRRSMALLKHLRSMTDGPVITMPSPMWRAGAQAARRLPKLRPEKYAALSRVLERRLAAMGVTYIGQPQATLNEDGRTLDIYSRAHTDGQAADGKYDKSHANAEYGGLLVEQINSTLAELQTARAGQ
ncbi:GSCFA domain-containing protein [Oceanibium sediminis]|uniref:GSCFA domain-containing protein n=1 Tax=Oceanibium sediminis TaxID=2026339 RepID=UPI000DD2CB51|nr:GSCFA domain-containing protein [Oceanibium sediminis]